MLVMVQEIQRTLLSAQPAEVSPVDDSGFCIRTNVITFLRDLTFYNLD